LKRRFLKKQVNYKVRPKKNPKIEKAILLDSIALESALRV
jgi:hypothetical protein